MAIVTTPTVLDEVTARTAGEVWKLNAGGSLTIKTDTRWHAKAPASMTGSLGSVNCAQGISTSGVPAPTAAEIWLYINRTLTASGGGSLTLAEIETSTVLAKEASLTQIGNSIAGMPSSAENATAVWTAPVSTMTDKTTIGGYIAKLVMTIPKFLGLK